MPSTGGGGGGAGTRRSVNKDGAGGPKQPGGLLSLLTTHVLSEDRGPCWKGSCHGQEGEAPTEEPAQHRTLALKMDEVVKPHLGASGCRGGNCGR